MLNALAKTKFKIVIVSGAQKTLLPYEQITDMSPAQGALKLIKS